MNSFRSLTHPERIQNLKGILLEPPEGIVHGNYHSAEEQQGHQQNSLKARPEKNDVRHGSAHKLWSSDYCHRG
jgi:hypothetical protein